jgi:uncharacterized membrane protein YphA (DoxX/SURF4 family)
MQGILGRFAPQIYALLRIVAGLLFAFHGVQKLFGVYGVQQVPIMSQLGLAGVIELPVLYCFIFLYVAARGNGTWSVQGGKKR